MKKIQASLLAVVVLVGIACAQPGSGSSATKLVSPATGKINVAFILTEGSVMIDFAGPWETFQDVMVPARGPKMEDQHVFHLYTVSDYKNPIHASSGIEIIPDYTFEDAPQPMIVVIPAQMGDSPKMLEWIRKTSARGNVVMSVCNGAFNLAETGLLDGHPATSYHTSYASFQHLFPKVQVERGRRWVQSTPTIFTAGGLSSGIDLALHIVELYYGRDIAQETARTMEYEGQGWMGDGSAIANHSRPTAATNPSDQYSTGVLGNWQGKIVTKDRNYTVAVHIWPAKDGTLSGTLDSLDEQANGIELDLVALTGNKLHFTVPSLKGSYEARLNQSNSAIEGTWKQNGQSLPLVLERVNK
jgi:putative intracellular protease/amidase